MRQNQPSHNDGKDMIRAPNATEVSHLFALAEHEIVKGRLTEALILLRFIRSIDPDHTDAAARLALTLFRREQWNEAWDAFDIRFKLMAAQPSVKIRIADGGSRELPRWRGGEPPKKLLVMDEQGLGDTLHFMRFLRPLVAQGVEINFVTHEILFDLIRTMNLPINLLPSNQPGSVNGATGWTPLLHIPRALGIDPKTYGDDIPYISADPVLVKSWARKIVPKGFKIGICWGGNPDSPAEKGRSMPLEAFAPLAAIPGVRLFSLQKGVPTKEISGVSFRRDLYDFGDELDGNGKAFVDTAAIMMSLDLIVTVDTSIAHLAGALGRPVNILLRREPDWRWLARETDTVWYPTAKLFRQRASDNWSEPMAMIVADIASRMKPNAEGISVDTLPKLPVSYGELADQIASLSIKLKKDGLLPADLTQRHNLASGEWNKLIESNSLLQSLQKEMEENLTALDDAEVNLVLLEAREEFGRPFIGCVRDIRLYKGKRADLMRRVDALVMPQMTGQETGKESVIASGQETKSEPKTARQNHKKAK